VSPPPDRPGSAADTTAGDANGPSDRLLALVGKPGGPLEDASLWTLEVVASSALTPTMRRIELGSPGLAELRYHPGQDLMLRVPTDAGTVTNRRYTIRALDREREVITCDVLLHGHGPGARWATDATPSDRIDAIGPRGKIWAESADWYWFLGDESAVPATLAMIEDLPPRHGRAGAARCCDLGRSAIVPARAAGTGRGRMAPARPGPLPELVDRLVE
jgi:NADPH-dependent ferric siderophore reductase